MKLLSFGDILYDVLESANHLGGAPLNFAAHAGMLGADSWVISAVGDDELGHHAISEAKSFGVNTDLIFVLPDKETGKCIVTLDKNGTPSYSHLRDVAYDHIKFPELDGSFDVFAFGSLALRDSHNREIVQKILSEYTFSEIFNDINIRAPFYSDESIRLCLENTTILKVSDEDLPAIEKSLSINAQNHEDIVSAISEKFPQLKLILLTKGENGSACYDCREKKFYHCNAKKTDVVATVGAGDSFGAAFLVMFFKGKSIKECLEFASQISAHVCSHADAIPKDMPEFLKKTFI